MIAKLIIIAWTCFIGWAFLSGLMNVVNSGASDTALAFALILSAPTHFAIWALVALPTYMLSRMFSRRTKNA